LQSHKSKEQKAENREQNAEKSQNPKVLSVALRLCFLLSDFGSFDLAILLASQPGRFPVGSVRVKLTTGRSDAACGVTRRGITHRESERRRDLMAGFVKMATLGELPSGGAQEVEYEGRIVAIFNVDGVISAIDGICPHQGGPLADGPLEGTCVTCPWHGWQFDVRTGTTPINSRIKQQVFEVKVEGQDILVQVG